MGVVVSSASVASSPPSSHSSFQLEKPGAGSQRRGSRPRTLSGSSSASGSGEAQPQPRLHWALAHVHRLQAHLRQRLDSNALPDPEPHEEEAPAPAPAPAPPRAPPARHGSWGSRRGSTSLNRDRTPERPEPPDPAAAAAAARMLKTFEPSAVPSLTVCPPPAPPRSAPEHPAEPPPRFLHGAREGYGELERAGLSLPALAALVNHAEFAGDPEAWAPALLALALCELADRGLAGFAPPAEDGIAAGEAGYGNFAVVLADPGGYEDAEGPGLPGGLGAIAAFVASRGGRATTLEICRAFIAQRDPEAEEGTGVRGRVYSRYTGALSRELAEAGLKRVLPHVAAFRLPPRPAPPPSGPGGPAPAPGGAGGGRPAISPSCPLTPAGRRAAVAGAVLAGALWEAERARRALSLLSRGLLRQLCSGPLYAYPPAEEPAAAYPRNPIPAALMLALEDRQRPRFAASLAGPAGAGPGADPLPGLGRVPPEPEPPGPEGGPAFSIDSADVLARVLFLTESRRPWGRRHLWENTWVAGLAAAREKESPGPGPGPGPEPSRQRPAPLAWAPPAPLELPGPAPPLPIAAA
eukprot:tig00020876_g14849.t1